jgi:hypothetical protein
MTFCVGAWFVAQAGPAAGAEFAAAAQRAFQTAQGQYKNDGGKPATACQFARACFDLAEFATNNSERADLAQQGMQACQQALNKEPKSALAHYYLAMNLGQLARTKSLGALRLVSRMEREFSLARDLDERIDYAGPDRSLGLLYRDAPSIGSIGSRTKSRQHLQRALELVSNYPENHLNLVETYLKWGERNSASRELKTLEEQLPAARAELAGPVWASSWADWDQRLTKVKKEIEEPLKPLESPRQK